MENNERKLGWAAIMLGVFLLGYMLGGHGNNRPQVYVVPGIASAPAAPAAVAPHGGFGPDAAFGPQDQFGPQQQERQEFRHGPFARGNNQQFEQHWMRERHRGPGFFGPLFLIGGLLKLLLLGFVIFCVVRFFRSGPWGGARPGGPWGRHRHERGEHYEKGETDRPSNPEPPANTGNTTQL